MGVSGTVRVRVRDTVRVRVGDTVRVKVRVRVRVRVRVKGLILQLLVPWSPHECALWVKV